MRDVLIRTAIGLVAVVILRWALRCALWPFRDCWLCKGRGYFRSKANRKLSRGCRRCGYTGKRLRVGRRVWNRAREKYRATGVGAGR